MHSPPPPPPACLARRGSRFVRGRRRRVGDTLWLRPMAGNAAADMLLPPLAAAGCCCWLLLLLLLPTARPSEFPRVWFVAVSPRLVCSRAGEEPARGRVAATPALFTCRPFWDY